MVGEAGGDGRQAEILLVRHGETEWSAAGRHTSRTDLPLVEAGRERASALGQELAGRSFALVLCSPLRRAQETCELAGFGAAAVVDEDLREWDYGEYEGMRTVEIRERRPDWWLWRDGAPGGEQPSDVAARADRVLERLRGAGGDAVAFAHGHILRVVASRWVGEDAAFGGHLLLGAGGLSVLGYERETPAIARWNLG
ncbi:MAG TPA: histidine phosphatase family protein [Solirubrobacteraceae bacterium]|nr:histidine phosphatase family protein [Solirubrobacteraceae bacterium]